MGPSRKELKDKYKLLSNSELTDLYHSYHELTEEAASVLTEELERRKISLKKTAEIKEEADLDVKEGNYIINDEYIKYRRYFMLSVTGIVAMAVLIGKDFFPRHELTTAEVYSYLPGLLVFIWFAVSNYNSMKKCMKSNH